jgi:Rod binding domain-containing protein
MSDITLDNPVADIAGLSARAPTASKTASPEAARKTAQSFEAYFLSQFVDRMFQGIPKDSLSGSGNGEEIFRTLLSQEYGKAMAAHGGVGIADQVYREILKTQEVH